MNTQLQQLYAEGRIDVEEYRTILLWTVLAKLSMAVVLGALMLCSMIVT